VALLRRQISQSSEAPFFWNKGGIEGSKTDPLMMFASQPQYAGRNLLSIASS
jgi:hypothetical protein